MLFELDESGASRSAFRSGKPAPKKLSGIESGFLSQEIPRKKSAFQRATAGVFAVISDASQLLTQEQHCPIYFRHKPERQTKNEPRTTTSQDTCVSVCVCGGGDYSLYIK